MKARTSNATIRTGVIQIMNLDVLLIYIVVSFFYVISPGPAIFLSISNAMSTNLRIVAISSLGNIIGLFLLSSISILGLGALLLASSTLFMVVKVIGASYLIYLGAKQFQIAKTTQSLVVRKEKTNIKKKAEYFYEGFFLAATNPKAILFFTAIFPQFLDLETSILPQFFIMTTTFMTLSFISLFSYGCISKSAKNLFANQNRMSWFHRISGGLFVGMGFSLLQLKNSLS